MPSGQLTFRSVCGQFAFVFNYFMLKRASLKIAMKTATLNARTRVDGVNIGLLLALLYFGNLLSLCGDIEQNPGPPKTSSTRQTRLTSCGKSRRCSIETPPPEGLPSTQSSPSEPTLKDVMDLLCSINDSWSQPYESSKTMDETQTAAKATGGDGPMTEESTDVDFSSILNSINSKFKEMQNDLLQLTNMCGKIQNEIMNMRGELSDLRNENADLKKTNSLLTDRVDTLEKKTDELEFKSKRNNLLFYGVKRKENETNDDCKKTVDKLLTDQLNISESIQFDRIHRLNSKPDSPILASVASFQQKELILRARRKLRGCNIFVSEDFPVRIRETRRKLVPFMKDAKKENKKVFIVYDHLVIDGRKFYLSQDGLKQKE